MKTKVFNDFNQKMITNYCLKMKKYKILIISFLLVFTIIFGIMAVLRKNYQNSAETSPDHEDPMMRTRIYRTDSDLVHTCLRIANIIPSLTNYGLNWKLINSDCHPGTDGSISLRAEVPVFFYTDDLEVRLNSGLPGTLIVNVYSASRVGKNDLGENRRHVLDILMVLDRELGK